MPKTLVHSVTWCPDGQPQRVRTVEKHLQRLFDYTGDFDILVTDNASEGEGREIVEKYAGSSLVRFPTNRGWAFARNYAINHMVENSYDIIIMLDCDVWSERDDIISYAQDATRDLECFMCRRYETQYMVGFKKTENFKWDLYDEWLGCINVATRRAIDLVGGYDLITFPQQWGFHDCEWGRRVLKAGLLKDLGGEKSYPSLYNGKVREEHDDEYDKVLKPMKDEVIAYANLFWESHVKILRGEKDIFFDYTIGLEEL